MIRVVVADDHHLVRQGIRALLEMHSDICVVGEADNGLDALSLVETLKPDVVILDINMPQSGGIEVTKEIQERMLPTQVLILSMYSDESLMKQAFRNGARGYLLKRSVTEELIEAVRSSSENIRYLSHEANEQLTVGDLSSNRLLDPKLPVETLTARELQLLKMIANGYTNQAIAHELGISPKTVEKHRGNLMRKMDVQDLAGLLRKGIRLGLIYLEE